MGKLANQVRIARSARDTVRQGFDARVAQVQQDIAARSIGERVADSAMAQVRDTLEEARAVAADNRAVIAGTVAALALWFLRNPILAALDKWLDHVRSPARVEAENMEHSDEQQ